MFRNVDDDWRSGLRRTDADVILIAFTRRI